MSTLVPDFVCFPGWILAYNKNKSGVNTIDKMLSGYSCKQATNRWSLAIFYNMFDVTGLALSIYDRARNQTSVVILYIGIGRAINNTKYGKTCCKTQDIWQANNQNGNAKILYILCKYIIHA